MIASGSSLRGLSEVSTATSAKTRGDRAHHGPLLPGPGPRRSRRPRSPFRRARLRLDARRAEDLRQPVRECGRSRRRPWRRCRWARPPAGRRCRRRPTARRRSSPPAPRAPGGGGGGEGVADVDLAARADPHRRPVEAEAALLAGRPRARRPRRARRTPTGIAAVSSSRRPNGSSALTTARLACSGVKSMRLGREVGLHGPVVVEVVLAQVREDGHVVAVAVEAVLDEGVRGDLERHGRPAGVPCLRERTLQVGRLRGRARAAEGADHRRRPAVRLEHRAKEVGRRRLAVGAGHPDGSQRRRPGRPQQRAGGERHGRDAPRPAPTTSWTARGRLACERALAHEGHRARHAPRRGAKSCPSTWSPGRQQCRAPGVDAAVVVGDRGDDDAGNVADDPPGREPAHDLLEADLRAGAHRPPELLTAYRRPTSPRRAPGRPWARCRSGAGRSA